MPSFYSICRYEQGIEIGDKKNEMDEVFTALHACFDLQFSCRLYKHGKKTKETQHQLNRQMKKMITIGWPLDVGPLNPPYIFTKSDDCSSNGL
ncbi:hypothetical protein OL548_22735 [Lysinibacillus sp. MHQ-1]|nr:hypothetical protein OL548_22735 [Lysinibacillus sp. MHQ-1]